MTDHVLCDTVACLTLAYSVQCMNPTSKLCPDTWGGRHFPVPVSQLHLVLIGGSGWKAQSFPNLSLWVNGTWREVAHPNV